MTTVLFGDDEKKSVYDAIDSAMRKGFVSVDVECIRADDLVFKRGGEHVFSAKVGTKASYIVDWLMRDGARHGIKCQYVALSPHPSLFYALRVDWSQINDRIATMESKYKGPLYATTPLITTVPPPSPSPPPPPLLQMASTNTSSPPLHLYVDYLNNQCVNGAQSVYAMQTPSEFFTSAGLKCERVPNINVPQFIDDMQRHVDNRENLTLDALVSKGWFLPYTTPTPTPTPPASVSVPHSAAPASPPPTPVASVSVSPIDAIYDHVTYMNQPPTILLPGHLANHQMASKVPNDVVQTLDQLQNDPHILVDTGKLMQLQLAADVTPGSVGLAAGHACAASIAHALTRFNSSADDIERMFKDQDPRALCHLDAVTQSIYNDMTPSSAASMRSVASATNQQADMATVVFLAKESDLNGCAKLRLVDNRHNHTYEHVGSGIRMEELSARVADPLVTHEYVPDDVRVHGINRLLEIVDNEHLATTSIVHPDHDRIGDSVGGLAARITSATVTHNPTLAAIGTIIAQMPLHHSEVVEQAFALATYDKRNHMPLDAQGLFEAVGRVEPDGCDSHKAFTEEYVNGFHDWQSVYGDTAPNQLDAAKLRACLAKMDPARASAMHNMMTRIAYIGRVQNTVDEAGRTPPQLEQIVRVIRTANAAKRASPDHKAQPWMLYIGADGNQSSIYAPTYPDPDEHSHMTAIMSTAAALGYASLTPSEQRAIAHTSFAMDALASRVTHFITESNPVTLSDGDACKMQAAARAVYTTTSASAKAPAVASTTSAKVTAAAAATAAATAAHAGVDRCAPASAHTVAAQTFAAFRSKITSAHWFEFLVGATMPDVRKPGTGHVFLVPNRTRAPPSGMKTPSERMNYVLRHTVRTSDPDRLADGDPVEFSSDEERQMFRKVVEYAKTINNQWFYVKSAQ